MYRKIVFNILLCLIFTLTKAQNDFQYEFIGSIKTESDVIMTYKLSFNINKNDTLEGETHTDFLGKNSTKSNIKGTFNRAEQSFSFIETGNIQTKSTANTGVFCFIKAENLKIKSKGNTSIVQGKFAGIFSNGKICAKGVLNLISVNILEKFGVDKSKLDNINLNDTIKPENFLSTKNQLTDKDNLELDWKSDKIKMYVWDSKIADQDKIDIYVNDKLFKEDILITEKKILLEIPFTNKKTVVKIFAKDEGNSPPNTVTAIMIDDDKITPVTTKLKKGQFVYITLNKR